jgi:YcaO-like protein with predicted kinase domain
MDFPEYFSYRAITPEQTLQNIQPFLSSIGITRVANITGLDEISIPVFVAIRPNSRSLSLAQGKGLTAINAKISAIMETVESYHAENPLLKTVRTSAADLKKNGFAVCDYENLPSISAHTFDDTHVIEWVHGTNLLNRARMYVPFEAVHTDMHVDKSLSNPYFIKSSNGLASGNTEQEAINHATCELIERDSYSCWTLLPKKEKTKVRIDSIDDPTCRALIERFYKAEAHIGIWDITSDIGLPAFLVRVIPRDKPPFCNIAPASGFGCHPDRNLSLIRALTEAAQSRLTFISGSRDDIRLSHYRSYIDPKEYQKWYTSVCEHNEFRDYTAIPTYCVKEENDIWSILQKSLVKSDIKEIISVDLSRPTFPIKVHKVIIPGLEGSEPYSYTRMGIRAQSLLLKYQRQFEHA